jgi:hypothetical protein
MKQYKTTSSSSAAYGDTVVITGLCVVPPKVLNWNVAGWTMLLYDTAASNSSWGAILVMANAYTDTTQLLSDGFLNVEAGDIINMTGVVAEFPNTRGFSGSEFIVLPGHSIDIVGSAPLPSWTPKTVADFYQGLSFTGKIQYASGEPFEDLLVEFTNLTVNAKVNTGRGTFSAVDAAGNEISTYDLSKFFTLANTTTRTPDTAWTRLYADINVGTRIDTLRGIMTTSSGQDGMRGYRIAPVYYGDVVLAPLPSPPLITTHRRNPVVVTPSDTAAITVRVTRQTNGSAPNTVSLLYGVNNASFAALPMIYQPADTTYRAVIPVQSSNAVVRYFIQVVDSFGQVIRLANSATTGSASDTSKGFFFYTVLNRPLTIRDVQYTPYINGRSPYLGAVIPLSGIMTADTTHVSLSPATTGSTNAWYMQSTSQPWSGIWLTTIDTAAQALLAATSNGDSVTVTGTVQEQFDVTRLGNITTVVKNGSGNPEPAPVALPTNAFNVANGVASAEAYEGMLVRFSNVTVTSVNPTFSDETEYSVNDGSGPVVVQRSGRYSYSNVPADTTLGKTILRIGNKIASLTGIVYYSFNQYKFVPRTDADFQGVILTGVDVSRDDVLPDAYALTQNFPNPFNPTTMIQYALPSAGPVTLRVYNMLGQEVSTLVNQVQAAGRYTVRFDAGSLASGLYFYRVQSGTFSAVKTMVLVK